ncbi:hypothetical protein [Mycolicibacter senuensis]|uniref:Uncharacterized protein n=1 Tax=Mycolicibacter senuensis TaxID=386913 RepID=A0A7I9XQC9_9MYCO|nr:hypothetical protein [Mycolicibacter senuensis]ORW66816.1 hypothetical protein AWC24_12660 [Mycolicibacter senuensis]GFG72202.1 hypothetical protein MSEN_39220 [Mycolicibacter senuensis]
MSPENLEPRVSALERQVGELRGEVRANKVEVATVRELAGAVDRDVSEMRGFRRATVAGFNALRADMVDMRQDITDLRQDMNDGFRRVDEQFAQVDEQFAQVGIGFAEMRAKFDMTAAGQQRIVELIQTVIDTPGDNAAD